jgi:hypothetical protein
LKHADAKAGFGSGSAFRTAGLHGRFGDGKLHERRCEQFVLKPTSRVIKRNGMKDGGDGIMHVGRHIKELIHQNHKEALTALLKLR